MAECMMLHSHFYMCRQDAPLAAEFEIERQNSHCNHTVQQQQQQYKVSVLSTTISSLHEINQEKARRYIAATQEKAADKHSHTHEAPEPAAGGSTGGGFIICCSRLCQSSLGVS